MVFIIAIEWSRKNKTREDQKWGEGGKGIEDMYIIIDCRQNKQCVGRVKLLRAVCTNWQSTQLNPCGGIRKTRESGGQNTSLEIEFSALSRSFFFFVIPLGDRVCCLRSPF